MSQPFSKPAETMGKVQRDAILAARRFRHVDPAVLPELFAALRHPSAQVSYVAAQLLGELGASHQAMEDEGMRATIAQALAEVSATQIATEGYHGLTTDGNWDAPAGAFPRLSTKVWHESWAQCCYFSPQTVARGRANGLSRSNRSFLWSGGGMTHTQRGSEAVLFERPEPCTQSDSVDVEQTPYSTQLQ